MDVKVTYSNRDADTRRWVEGECFDGYPFIEDVVWEAHLMAAAMGGFARVQLWVDGKLMRDTHNLVKTS